MKYISCNENQTKKIARNLAKKLTGGEIICLQGNLGAGKTVFTKGLAEALGSKEIITSPTFVLMKIYKMRHKKIKTLVHIDCYRLENPQEVLNIGAKEYFNKENTVVVIEWAKKIVKLISLEKKIKVKFENISKKNRVINIRQ